MGAVEKRVLASEGKKQLATMALSIAEKLLSIRMTEAATEEMIAVGEVDEYPLLLWQLPNGAHVANADAVGSYYLDLFEGSLTTMDGFDFYNLVKFITNEIGKLTCEYMG